MDFNTYLFVTVILPIFGPVLIWIVGMALYHDKKGINK